jgi:hypothetical protein
VGGLGAGDRGRVVDRCFGSLAVSSACPQPGTEPPGRLGWLAAVFAGWWDLRWVAFFGFRRGPGFDDRGVVAFCSRRLESRGGCIRLPAVPGCDDCRGGRLCSRRLTSRGGLRFSTSSRSRFRRSPRVGCLGGGWARAIGAGLWTGASVPGRCLQPAHNPASSQHDRLGWVVTVVRAGWRLGWVAFGFRPFPVSTIASGALVGLTTAVVMCSILPADPSKLLWGKEIHSKVGGGSTEQVLGRLAYVRG